MYLPAHFEERRPEVLQQLMRSHPLGLLVTLADAGLQANPVPFMLDADRGAHGTLLAHVARANPLWRQTRSDVEALVVFQGPQAYISPALYASKAVDGKVVPTWNYCMVQARGSLRAVDDAPWLHVLVSRLTQRMESPRGAPWAVGDAPDDYIATMIRGIVGIEITLSSLVGKWKVSQNRDAADREGVAAGLAGQADAAPGAAAMAVQVLTPGAPL